MNGWLQLWPPWRTAGCDPAQLERLAALLQLTQRDVLSIRDNRRLSYRTFTIAKRHGARRRIQSPSGELKQLQRRLLRNYLAELPTSSCALAFRPRRSIADHAARHAGQAVILSTDLADFFPRTSTRRVRRWFQEQGWSGAAIDVLVRLCTHQGGLPQGAPTSPALSNLVNLELDRELSEAAACSGGRYSRYSDDLAFSWPQAKPRRGFRLEIEAIVGRFGYEVNQLKGWREQLAQEQPVLTGVRIVGRRLQPTTATLQRIRELRRIWPKPAKVRAQLTGYLGFLKMLKNRG